MKKRIIASLLILLTLVGSVFAASVNSAPAATVNLIRNKVITTQELNDAIALYAGTGLSDLEVLQILINDEVFLQGAERAGVTLTSSQLDSLYAQQKSSIEQQVGASLTNEQYDQLIAQQYGSVENAKEYLKNQYILNTYVMQEKGDELNSASYAPTDTEIRNYYRKNQTTFVMSEYVKFSQIIKYKSEDAAANEAARNTLNQVYSDINSGKITFEAAVNQYTDDEEAKAVGGEAGWLMSSNTTAREGFGDEFVDTVLGQGVGVVSPVLESNIGYHIVKVSVHQDAKLLGINDRINPEESTTVYQYIQAGLAQQNMQIALSAAVDEILADLTKEARIRILYK